ncbi:MdtA/MuxA family multidrug efflux RND transporter periplasmic adaptor subunit [Opitutus terrae]|uniref:Efflux transporter, RND family, MFP subunit n=1 Tax=Opitutus terrae (strain DSM 11246 / JCM 15787 / PB90-1) TaxID=452637 RepID=B1ZNH8_OPITP|nr:MdtA/MuxA family multidrug efflux RND transporter periplasmic adaptor subunit [Opitutus terrae]ACB74412.1 efflux transporter, RND family, MFP subunit [Opitutus terrae PB90-1]
MSLFSRPRFRWFLYVAVVLLMGFGTWYFALRSKPERPRYPQPEWAGNTWPPLIPVRTVTAEKRDLPVHLKAIGTVTPLNTVTVKARVPGQLLRIAFEEGQRVERGQVLAEIDPAPYRIVLAQAEGRLQQAMAQLESARSDFERTTNLHRQNLVTDQQLQLQDALVAERAGAVATAQAQVEDARLQLSYTRVEAPIAGRAGLRRVDVGNLIREGDTNGLVVLTQTRPITVTFTIPEVDLQSVLDPFRAGESLVVEAWDRRETAVLATGVLKTLDNQIDTATGTLKLKAEFANEDERLFPNQFVNVRLRVRTLEQAVVIPAAAVQFGSRGTYVYLVDADKKAAIRDVVLGPVDGSEQAITKGLAPGDQVVLEGLDRLREGRGVIVTNDPASAAPAAPAAASNGNAKAARK